MIGKYLDLSTAHLTPATRELLDDEPDFVTTVMKHPGGYGWLVYVQQDDVDPEEDAENIPPDLLACLKLAREHDCVWMLFDCDADTIPGLPTYDDDGNPETTEGSK
jgi:hypothetical protein